MLGGLLCICSCKETWKKIEDARDKVIASADITVAYKRPPPFFIPSSAARIAYKGNCDFNGSTRFPQILDCEYRCLQTARSVGLTPQCDSASGSAACTIAIGEQPFGKFLIPKYLFGNVQQHNRTLNSEAKPRALERVAQHRQPAHWCPFHGL